MAKILFLSHRVPYPPNKGDKIRSWNILQRLARDHEVHLGCFLDDPDDWRHFDRISALCASCHFIPLRRWRGRLRSLRALATGSCLSVAHYASPAMRAWLRGQFASQNFDAAFLFSGAMAVDFLRVRPKGLRTAMDFVDVDSDKWRQYSEAMGWPMRWLYGLEARRLLGFERRVAAACDRSLFVSEPEADLFRALAPEVAAKVHALENGVDHRYFDPDAVVPLDRPQPGPLLVFTGAMDYHANVDATSWFTAEIWPRISAVHPDARFIIVGGNPTPQVKALGDLPGVTVTGRIADVRPHLAAADVVVAPMRIARGVQNKVLEGMAMARPVVASPQGFEGIDATPSRHLLVAADAASFAAQILALLADPARARQVGLAARQRVVERYDWATTVAPLTAWLKGGKA